MYAGRGTSQCSLIAGRTRTACKRSGQRTCRRPSSVQPVLFHLPGATRCVVGAHHAASVDAVDAVPHARTELCCQAFAAACRVMPAGALGAQPVGGAHLVAVDVGGHAGGTVARELPKIRVDPAQRVLRQGNEMGHGDAVVLLRPVQEALQQLALHAVVHRYLRKIGGRRSAQVEAAQIQLYAPLPAADDHVEDCRQRLAGLHAQDDLDDHVHPQVVQRVDARQGCLEAAGTAGDAVVHCGIGAVQRRDDAHPGRCGCQRLCQTAPHKLVQIGQHGQLKAHPGQTGDDLHDVGMQQRLAAGDGDGGNALACHGFLHRGDDVRYGGEIHLPVRMLRAVGTGHAGMGAGVGDLQIKILGHVSSSILSARPPGAAAALPAEGTCFCSACIRTRPPPPCPAG